MMLLSKSRTVYHGPAKDAIEYFETIGYFCEEHNNPPDFFLDVVNGDALSTDKRPLEHKNGNSDEGFVSRIQVKETANDRRSLGGKLIESVPNGMDYEDDVEKVDPDANKESNLAVKLNSEYVKSEWHNNVQQDVQVIFNEFMHSQRSDAEVRKINYPTGSLHQFRIVAKRSVLNILRNPQTSVLQMIVMVIFAVICGVIYLQIDNSYPTGVQNRVGAFFFIIMNQVFGNLSAVELFIKERAIFIHENVSGFYRVAPYFLAKLLCDIIPLRAIPLLVFSAIVYFMIGFIPTPQNFFYFFLTLLLVGLSASAIGFAVSASVRVFAIANLLIALSYVFMMVFSGLLVNIKTIPVWLRWIQYFSIFRYALNSLSINELKDFKFCVKINGTISDICSDFGNDYLEEQGIAYTTAWDKWQNIVALACIALLFLILAFIQLVRIKKLK